jgi:hypothetical protein
LASVDYPVAGGFYSWRGDDGLNFSLQGTPYSLTESHGNAEHDNH